MLAIVLAVVFVPPWMLDVIVLVTPTVMVLTTDGALFVTVATVGNTVNITVCVIVTLTGEVKFCLA